MRFNDMKAVRSALKYVNGEVSVSLNGYHVMSGAASNRTVQDAILNLDHMGHSGKVKLLATATNTHDGKFNKCFWFVSEGMEENVREQIETFASELKVTYY